MEASYTFVLLIGLVAVGATVGCQGADLPKDTPSLLEVARLEQANASAESDVAVILSRAQAAVQKAPPDRHVAILTEALKQARKAKNFTIANEAPLPENWPEPSVPGLVRIKAYPAVRSAWVRSSELKNGQFMTLFRHIEKRKIAMTAPVVMEYDAGAAKDPAKMNSTEAMAFLYRHADQDEAGTYGPISVENTEVLHVVSVGVKGAYTTGKFRQALASLVDWLADQDQWRPSGAPRVLGYNSPFMLFWRKYSEVQIPVRPTDKNKAKPAAEAETPLRAGEPERARLPRNQGNRNG